MLSIRKVRLLITSRYIAMQSYECIIISKMFLIYFISYGCNGGALVFLGGAKASASPSYALPMFITIKKIIILHLFLGVPAATVGGTGTPWHTRGYAPEHHLLFFVIFYVQSAFSTPRCRSQKCYLSLKHSFWRLSTNKRFKAASCWIASNEFWLVERTYRI